MKIYTNIKDFKGVKNPVVTVGTFDGVHLGHQVILKKLNEIADKTGGESVLLTFFPHPRMVLFPEDDSIKLINTLKEKTDLLESYGLDHVIILPFSKEFSRMTPTEYIRDLLVRDIGVKTLVIGYDHQFGRNREGNFALLEELAPTFGFNVKEISAKEIDDIKVSSTKIRKAIEIGDLKTAKDYSGHTFSLSGIVTEGAKIGRQLGYPTANIEILEKHKIIPGIGVYAVYVTINDLKYKGMLNIGIRPTITNNNTNISIEAHIFNFNETIYNKIIKVEFIAKLRNEQHFMDLDQLKSQLTQDKKHALNVLD